MADRTSAPPHLTSPHPTLPHPTAARLAASLNGRLPQPGQAIGLFGGSFNPAHEAHRALSLEALKRLRLDEVWWLVSPLNPLKPAQGMASLADRLSAAKRATRHPRLRVSDLERVLGTRYSLDTILALKARFPRVDFVWLMGADNLAQMARWSRWPQIFHTVPVAIFDRPSYSLGALAAKPSRRFARHRLDDRKAGGLARVRPPAWVFVHMPLNPQSATYIRSRSGTTPDTGTNRNPATKV